MNPNERFDILILDTDNERRMRLKATTASTSFFRNVQLSRDFRSALDQLNAGLDRVIVFLGQEAGEAPIRDFVAAAKKTRHGQDSAYILVLKNANSSKAALAQSVLEGVDGLLIEPFSIDSLEEVTRIASSVYKQRKLEREEATVTFLVESLLSLVDSVSTSKIMGRAPGEAIRELRSLGGTIKEMSEHLFPYYVRQLIDKSEAAKPPIELELFLKKQAQDEEKILERLKAKMAERGMTETSLDKPSGSSSTQARIIKKR